MSIGENVRKIRELKGMTQQELADSIGISRSYLGDLEKNRRNPSTETIEKLSELLGVSVFYIMKGMKTKQDELFFNKIKKNDFNDLIDEIMNKKAEDVKRIVNNLENTSENRQIFDSIHTLLMLDKSLITDYEDTDYKELVELFFTSISYFNYFVLEYRTTDPEDSNYKSEKSHLDIALEDFIASQNHTEDAAIKLVEKFEIE